MIYEMKTFETIEASVTHVGGRGKKWEKQKEILDD